MSKKTEEKPLEGQINLNKEMLKGKTLMTLEEAILHCYEVSQKDGVCEDCKLDHLQLAIWLEELANYRKEVPKIQKQVEKVLKVLKEC